MQQPVPVYLVEYGNDGLPLSLGVIEASLRAFGDGSLSDRLDFHHLASPSEEDLRSAPPGLWLFANYVWSWERNLEASSRVKAASPRNLTIHGGPSTPKRAEACERFLAGQPHIDVAVRGEGELTAAELLDRLARARAEDGDWQAGLEAVRGISYLDAASGKVVRTPERERITDLSTVPSAYLTGAMDPWILPRFQFATVETSRGCPYGCTFCDWGSATLQKIHKFDLDCIKAEIEWIASRGFPVLFISDANFGMFDRDVEIAEYVGNMRRKHGFPKEAIVSYAKNGNPRIPEIVRAMVSAGVVTQGVISIQTRDPEALGAVKRSNIKTHNYEKLVGEYRAQGLPATTDLMVGLPGATLDSHKRDVQWCIDEDLIARFFQTAVLPNSPMADPEYVRKHGLVIRNSFVAATATASAEELRWAWDLVRVYELTEKSTLLRYVMRYLQWEYGLPASDLLFSIARTCRLEPDRFPWYLTAGSDGMALSKIDCMQEIRKDPEPFYESIWAHIRERMGLALGSEADRIVFQLNAALVPRRGARYPIDVESHWNVLDYFASCIAPQSGETRKLMRTDRPQSFQITDPQGLATMDLEDASINNNALRVFELHWPCLNPVMVNIIS